MTDIDYLGSYGRKVFLDFQHLARATAVYPGRGHMVGKMYAALGLCGESGEVAEQVKKMWRNEGEVSPERVAAVKDELGDVMWYVALCCEEWGLSLGDVCEAVIQKLQVRQAEGGLKHE